MIIALGKRRPEIGGEVFIADNATVIGSVVLGNASSIWFNTVVRGDCDLIIIGEGSNVQDGCVLHTDPAFPLTIGSRVTVGHMAVLHGCTIGDGSLIGINSVILNGAVIGRNCLIGAGSLVTEGKEIPDGSLALGSPAKVMRQLKPEEIAAMAENAQHYVERSRLYRREARAISC